MPRSHLAVWHQCCETLEEEGISFVNDVISLFFLPHCIDCHPLKFFPCDHFKPGANSTVGLLEEGLFTHGQIHAQQVTIVGRYGTGKFLSS